MCNHMEQDKYHTVIMGNFRGGIFPWFLKMRPEFIMVHTNFRAHKNYPVYNISPDKGPNLLEVHVLAVLT